MGGPVAIIKIVFCFSFIIWGEKYFGNVCVHILAPKIMKQILVDFLEPDL
jgi:hypothetical protein